MKKYALAAILMIASFNLFAETATQPIVSSGTEIPYRSKMTRSPDGATTVLSLDKVFVGESVVRNEDGTCSKQTVRLVAMRTVTSPEDPELSFEAPELHKRSVKVACPS